MPPVAQLPRVCALLPRPSCDVRARSASRVTCMTMEAFCHSNNINKGAVLGNRGITRLALFLIWELGKSGVVLTNLA